MKDTVHVREQFRKYLDGSLPADEVETLLSYLRDERNTGQVQDLIMAHLDNPPDAEISEDQAVQQRLAAAQRFVKERISQHQPIVVPFIPGWSRLAGAAAAILIICLTYVFWPVQQVTIITVSTTYGQRKTIVLPDSSIVWLNAGSRIQYPASFGKKERSVNLVGQAYFDVVHDTGKPFTVHAENLDVIVLGTSFDVKTYQDEAESRVTVHTGKVGVVRQGSDLTTYLLPNQQAVYSEKSATISKRNVSAGALTAWRNNRLEFDGESLGMVLRALERAYNMRIEAADTTLLNRQITVKLENQPIRNIMDILAYGNGFTYTTQGDSLITIKKLPMK